MKQLCVFFIFLLPITFAFAEVMEAFSEDTTFSGQTVDENYVPREWCRNIEKNFFEHIKKVMSGTAASLKESASCLLGQTKSAQCTASNAQNLSLLEKNRALLKKLHQEVAHEWIQKDDKTNGGFTKKCLLNKSGQFEFERNIRLLKPQLSPLDCQIVLQKWSIEFEEIVTKKLNQTLPTSTLSTKELEQLQKFHQSPLKRALDANSLYEVTPPAGELQKQLGIATSNMEKGITKLLEKIKKSSPSEYYKLFVYENQFEQFVKMGPTQDQQKSLMCKRKICDGFDAKCLNQLWGVVVDWTPIGSVVAMIDLANIGDVFSAEAAGIMTRSEASEKRSEIVNNALWSLTDVAGVGVAAKIAAPAAKKVVKTAAKKAGERLASVQESIVKILPEKLKLRAQNYLRGNARANREATSVFNRINELSTSMPGHLPEELATRMQTSITKILPDIQTTNNLRFLNDYDQLLAQLARTTKGSPEYNDLVSRIEMRTRALEAIYKNTSPGSFEARVYEAIRQSDVPSAITHDVAHCFITGTRSQGSLFWKILFPKVYATIRADKFCDIPIAGILKKQDPQGWVDLGNGKKQRFLIEQWDCDDCGTKKVPAWVHVLRENDMEDLAKVTHCPGCGNPKEAHEKFYGGWTHDSKGKITNATQDDIVRAGGRDKANTAAKSDEHHCGFCGTIVDVDSHKCKSCGAGDIAHLADTSMKGVGEAPHAPRAKPPDSHSSGSGRKTSIEDEKAAKKATSEVVSSKKGAIVAGTAVVAAAGAGGYYLLKSTDVEAKVTSMSWEHTITLERNTVVAKSGWKSNIPSRAASVSECSKKFSHTEDVECGTENYSYTIKGSCTHGSSNGITVETCTEDTVANGTRPKYCPKDVERDWCNYTVYEWKHVTSRSTSGSGPNGAAALPWPNLTANGSNERILRKATYTVRFQFDAFGKPETNIISPSSENEFEHWHVGDRATGTYSRGNGLKDLKKK